MSADSILMSCLQSRPPAKLDGRHQAADVIDKTDTKGSRPAEQADKDIGSRAQPPAQDKAQQEFSEAPARDSSKTVFVRALPLDVSQDQLRLVFNKFGKLRACRSACLHVHSFHDILTLNIRTFLL